MGRKQPDRPRAGGGGKGRGKEISDMSNDRRNYQTSKWDGKEKKQKKTKKKSADHRNDSKGRK